jgi:hypothetical protein
MQAVAPMSVAPDARVTPTSVTDVRTPWLRQIVNTEPSGGCIFSTFACESVVTYASCGERIA